MFVLFCYLTVVFNYRISKEFKNRRSNTIFLKENMDYKGNSLSTEDTCPEPDSRNTRSQFNMENIEWKPPSDYLALEGEIKRYNKR